MAGAILGQKSEQSQTFNEKGERIPTTFIRTNPCYLIKINWPEKHGYFSVKMGFGQTKNINKPQLGELNKAGIKTPLRFLKEIRLDPSLAKDIKLKEGEEIKPSVLFKKDDLVDVSGTSKGKGFQGVVKRHHFAGGPRTHGQSDRERAPGAIGMTTTPGRVYKGKRMAGRMGGERVTLRRLRIVEVKDDGILVAGLVPGAKDGFLEIRSSI